MPIAFLSKEIIILGIGLASGGFVAWNDIVTDVQTNTTTIEEREKLNAQRYENLKEGQDHIQDTLEKLLRELPRNNDRD